MWSLARCAWVILMGLVSSDEGLNALGLRDPEQVELMERAFIEWRLAFEIAINLAGGLALL